VNVSAFPKVRVDSDKFLAWSQRQPEDVDTKFIDASTVASMRRCLILFPQRRAVVPHERNATRKIESPIVHGDATALNPPGIPASVAALLGC
jgi:hypothetical protein